MLTDNGETVTARRAVLADMSAPALYGELVGADQLPTQLTADLKRFPWDFASPAGCAWPSRPGPRSRSSSSGRPGLVLCDSGVVDRFRRGA